MDANTFSLKWKKHQSTFLHTLSNIRKQNRYSDATLACDGKFYRVHKLVLSSCSAYFEQMFEITEGRDPIIVLKDISGEQLDSLLTYMYIGSVNVARDKLEGLFEAAECLGVKGLTGTNDGVVAGPADWTLAELDASSVAGKKKRDKPAEFTWHRRSEVYGLDKSANALPSGAAGQASANFETQNDGPQEVLVPSRQRAGIENIVEPTIPISTCPSCPTHPFIPCSLHPCHPSPCSLKPILPSSEANDPTFPYVDNEVQTHDLTSGNVPKWHGGEGGHMDLDSGVGSQSSLDFIGGTPFTSVEPSGLGLPPDALDLSVAVDGGSLWSPKPSQFGLLSPVYETAEVDTRSHASCWHSVIDTAPASQAQEAVHPVQDVGTQTSSQHVEGMGVGSSSSVGFPQCSFVHKKPSCLNHTLSSDVGCQNPEAGSSSRHSGTDVGAYTDSSKFDPSIKVHPPLLSNLAPTNGSAHSNHAHYSSPNPPIVRDTRSVSDSLGSDLCSSQQGRADHVEPATSSRASPSGVYPSAVDASRVNFLAEEPSNTFDLDFGTRWQITRDLLSPNQVEVPFDGQIDKYRSWKHRIQYEIALSACHPTTALQILISNTVGYPHEMLNRVKTLESSPEKLLREAWSRLDANYDHPLLRANSLLEQLYETDTIPACSYSDPRFQMCVRKMDDLSMLCGRIKDSMPTCPELKMLDTHWGVSLIIGKLPPKFKEKWEVYLYDYLKYDKSFPSFSNFEKFLAQYVKTMRQLSHYMAPASISYQKTGLVSKKAYRKHKRRRSRPPTHTHNIPSLMSINLNAA